MQKVVTGLVVIALVGVGAWLVVGMDDNGNGETDDNGNGESEGRLEISFLGEDYSFDDASCEGRMTPDPDDEQMVYTNSEEEVEFWVRRINPEESDNVRVYMGFPTFDTGETIGEVEGYSADVPADEVSFELGSGSSGSAELEPDTANMDDDVEFVEAGGTIEWDLSC